MSPRRAMIAALAALAALAAGALGAPAASQAGVSYAGSSGLGDTLLPEAGNGGYDVLFYNINLRYKASTNYLFGNTKIVATVDGDQTGDLPLRRMDLDYRGPKVGLTRIDEFAVGHSRSGQNLRIYFDQPIPAGQQFTIEVSYHGHPEPVVDADGSSEGWIETPDGAVALGEPQGSPSWFPSNDHPSDKATYRISITTNKPAIGISNGELVRRSSTKRLTTRVWRQDEPMATYLALVAIGRYEVDRKPMNGIGYFAAVDSNLKKPAAKLASLRRNTRIALNRIEPLAGDYPYSSIGGVIDPAPVSYGLETQNRPYYPGPPGRPFVIHEIAHQWFGNSTTPNDWSQTWLNEGFATYMEHLDRELRGGATTAEYFASRYAQFSPAATDFWNPPPAAITDPADMFATSTYERGAMALEVLRQEIGDAEFFQLLQSWHQLHESDSYDTGDLLDTVENIHGSIPPLFEDWLFDEDKPAAP